MPRNIADIIADAIDDAELNVSTEQIQDVVGAMFIPSGTVTPTYNDAAGTISLAASGVGGEGGSGVFVMPIRVGDRLTPIIDAAADVMSQAVAYPFTAMSVQAYLTNPCASGTFTVDINKNGVSILSTKITITAGERNSLSAAVQPVISDGDFEAGDEITIDVDDAGDGSASGLIVSLVNATVAPIAGVDADAQAYITAAGITDATQRAAAIMLVEDLKAISDGVVWADKLDIVYPHLGASEAAHKINLKDPRDLDAAFRTTFVGPWTHDENGVTGDGLASYARTHFIPSAQRADGDEHCGVVITTNSVGSGDPYDIGAFTDGSHRSMIQARNSSDQMTGAMNETVVQVANADSRGHYIMTRRGATEAEFYKDGVSVGVATPPGQPLGAIPTTEYVFGALRSDYGHSGRRITGLHIGGTLTDAEAAAVTAAFDAFNTFLGRAV
jgi:hypothetical protein